MTYSRIRPETDTISCRLRDFETCNGDSLWAHSFQGMRLRGTSLVSGLATAREDDQDALYSSQSEIQQHNTQVMFSFGAYFIIVKLASTSSGLPGINKDKIRRLRFTIAFFAFACPDLMCTSIPTLPTTQRTTT